MSENPVDPVDSDPEVKHLEVEEYTDADRVEFPDWYDDGINVGEKANAIAEALSRESEEPS